MALTRREVVRALGTGGLGIVASLVVYRSGLNRSLGGGTAGASTLQPTSRSTTTFPRGAIIRTVLKDVAPDSLGLVAVHEHLHMSSSFGINGGPGAPQPSIHFSEDFDVMVEELRAAARDGVTCVVDASHAEQGRRQPYLRQLSKHSGVPIVVSGGYHSESSYPPEVRRATEDELADEFVRYAEAERWGALGEIGVNADLTDTTKKVMRAISRAHAQTGLPIFTHTHFGQWAIEQLDLYTSMGVPPQRLCIGHLADLAEDPAAPVQKAIARRGAYVGLDRVTSRTPEFDTKAISIAKALIDAGYVDHILVGSDGGAFENILKQKGGPGYARAYTMFIPKLRAAGVSDAIIRRITVDNPRRFLAFVPKKGK